MVSRLRGFSLVELLVSITIGLFVLAAVVTVLVNSKQNYTVQDSLARLQENARFAVDFITRDLRMSGHFGCAHLPLGTANNQLNVLASPLLEANGGLAGVDDIVVGASTWQPSGAPTAQPGGTIQFVPGSDVVLVRYMNGVGVPLTASMTAVTAPVTIAAGNGLNQGDNVIVADCNTADVFRITSANPDTTGVLGHAPGVADNTSDALSKPYELDQNPVVTSFMIARYFIATNTARPGRLGLYRQVGAAAPQELVEGIENMQVLYGVDTDPRPPPPQVPNYSPNVYVTAENVGCLVLDGSGACIGWDRVTSLRIGLLAYTLASESYDDSGEYGRLEDAGTYDVNGKILRTADGNLDAKRVKRRVFTTTIALRNLRP